MKNLALIILSFWILTACTCKIVYVNIEGQNTIDAKDVQMKTETDQASNGQLDAQVLPQ